MSSTMRTPFAAMLDFEVPAAAPQVAVHAERGRDGYVECAVSYASGEGPVPALLLVPDEPGGGAVVVHHQHNGQWHFGKSEVAGLCGDPLQAFGPALARRGVTVL